MSEPPRDFEFLDPGDLLDGDLRLVLAETTPPDPDKGLVPAYVFTMTHAETGARMGRLSIRIGDAPVVVRYIGHIGYTVEPDFRGHRYAARSCRLVLPLAKRHGVSPLWITCSADNIASRRTCEILGCELVNIIDVPEGNILYKQGQRRTCRYRMWP